MLEYRQLIDNLEEVIECWQQEHLPLSLEGKTNKQGIRWTGNKVEWSGLKLTAIISNDPVMLHSLSSKIKYVRLVRRILNHKTYWYVQLVCKGLPYQKPKNIINDGSVGIDLGVSTVAIVGDSQTIWGASHLCKKRKRRVVV
jgi:transposase